MVSVIVPAYNAEKYITSCLQSLLSQDYPNYEIVIVNDGSTDKTRMILEQFSRDYPDKIVVFNQMNGGVSAARNKALELARGKYIVFCDSDDVVSQDYISTLMAHKKEKTLVLAKYSLKIEDIQLCREPYSVNLFSFNCSNASINKLAPLIMDARLQGPYCKLFEADLIKMHKIRFDESMCLGEDFKFILEYLRYCEFICDVDKNIYCYMFNPNGITRRMNADKIKSQLKIEHLLQLFISQCMDDTHELQNVLNTIVITNYYNMLLLVYAYNRECRYLHEILKKDPITQQAKSQIKTVQMSFLKKLVVWFDFVLCWELAAGIKRMKDIIRSMKN